MTAAEFMHRFPDPVEALSVVIFHEGYEALTSASALCDRLVQRFEPELNIRVNHWPLEALEEEPMAGEAAADTATADIIVVASSREGEFATNFTAWLERWLPDRGGREGAVVGLFTPEEETYGRSCEKDIQLHRLALRAGLDYLNHLPDACTGRLPDTMNWCESRAQMVTGTLDQIIRNQPRPRL